MSNSADSIQHATTLDLDDVRAAATRIQSHVHHTPVLSSHSIDLQLGASIFFKCENFQKVGAFKARGATNAIFALPEEALHNGVATHSSGNHAAALARAARLRGAHATVVMPSNSSRVKMAAVRNYGGEIVTCEPNHASREQALTAVVRQSGATVVHPFDDEFVIAGQGTAALEFVDEISDLDIVIAPVGGGGLIGGTCIAVSGTSPQTTIIGAEPTGADDAARSFEAGRIIAHDSPQTIADGLRVSAPGELTFPIMMAHLQRIITVGEDDIVRAMRLVWERLKILIEPSAAVPVAAICREVSIFEGKRVGVIISGGNIDLDALPWS